MNYLDTGNITDNKINAIQYIDIENEKLPSRARRKVQENSIIYSTVRPKQRHFGIIKNQPDNFLVSTGFVVIDVNESILDADFLYYLLTQNIVVEKLHIIAEQSVSTYPSIKPSDIENLEISIPDIVVQKRIASILGCLDKKIEQNNMINKNLCEQRAGQAGMAETDAGSLLTGGRLRQTGTIRRLPDSEGAQAPEPARHIAA